MHTSYYAKSGRHPNAVAISILVPTFYTGRRYTPLAPSLNILNQYKQTKNENLYTQRYIKEILGRLSPEMVYLELGSDAVLLCYESPEKFCHRHIVADWLGKHLQIEVTELVFK